MGKVILVDTSGLLVPSIMNWESQVIAKQQSGRKDQFIWPAHCSYLISVISSLKKIGVDKDTKIIMALEGKSFRKLIYAPYKAQREGARKEHKLIDWDKEYGNANKLHEQLKEATDWNFVQVFDGLEADDVCVSKGTYIASPKVNAGKRVACKMNVDDPVYTYNEKTGDVEIGYIKKVMTRKTYSQKKLYFHNNTSLEITENHPVLTTNNIWTKVKDLKVGNEIFHLSATQNNKYVVKIPKNILNSHDYYRLGYLIGSINGDGHFDYKRNRIAFNIDDEDFARRLICYFDTIFNYKTTFSKKGKTFRILIGNKLIFDYMTYIDSKEIENKSFIKGYLAGFFDSEGNTYYTEGTWRLQVSNINKKRILKIQKYYKILGFDYKLTKRKQEPNNLYLLTSTAKNNINVLSLIRPAILRKYPNYDAHSRYLENGLKIIKIEDKKIHPKRGHTVYNFEVEPNNNYFANNALVHNCAIACRYFPDDEKIVVSGDADLKMLTYYPNTHFYNLFKKCKGSKGMYEKINDPLKIIADKARKGDVSDNIIPSPDDEDEDFALRYQLVNLLELPKEIEERGIKAIEKELDRPKSVNIDGLPTYIQERFPQIYNSPNKITPEYCFKLQEKRDIKKKAELKIKNEAKRLKKYQDEFKGREVNSLNKREWNKLNKCELLRVIFNDVPETFEELIKT